MGRFEEEEELSKIKRHPDFEINKEYALSEIYRLQPKLLKIANGIQPIKMKAQDTYIMVSLQGPFGCEKGSYAYPVPYSQPTYEFKQELKNVLIATWELYHSSFKRFYEV